MANFQFLNAEGKPVPLAEIDRRVCEGLNEGVDEKNFSGWYQAIVNAGMSILMFEGGHEITVEMFERYVQRHAKQFNGTLDSRDAVFFGLARYFLCGANLGGTTFNAWR